MTAVAACPTGGRVRVDTMLVGLVGLEEVLVAEFFVAQLAVRLWIEDL